MRTMWRGLAVSFAMIVAATTAPSPAAAQTAIPPEVAEQLGLLSPVAAPACKDVAIAVLVLPQALGPATGLPLPAVPVDSLAPAFDTCSAIPAADVKFRCGTDGTVKDTLASTPAGAVTGLLDVNVSAAVAGQLSIFEKTIGGPAGLGLAALLLGPLDCTQIENVAEGTPVPEAPASAAASVDSSTSSSDGGFAPTGSLFPSDAAAAFDAPSSGGAQQVAVGGSPISSTTAGGSDDFPFAPFLVLAMAAAALGLWVVSSQSASSDAPVV